MKFRFSDLTLKDVLSDPLIRTVMAADRVDPDNLETMLSTMASVIADRSAEAKSARWLACCT